MGMLLCPLLYLLITVGDSAAADAVLEELFTPYNKVSAGSGQGGEGAFSGGHGTSGVGGHASGMVAASRDGLMSSSANALQRGSVTSAHRPVLKSRGSAKSRGSLFEERERNVERGSGIAEKKQSQASPIRDFSVGNPSSHRVPQADSPGEEQRANYHQLITMATMNLNGMIANAIENGVADTTEERQSFPGFEGELRSITL
eukprot:gene3703-4619_t